MGTMMAGLMLFSLLGSNAQNNQEIFEQDILTGNKLGDKSNAYYQMTISERYFTGKENLAIRAIVESFNSDPDIFISKTNMNPSSSMDSDWYCVKRGSDTCIIGKDEIQTGDMLYITVQCLTPCQYTLLSDYFTTQTVDQDVRKQIRLDGLSSNLFEYYIPQDASDGFARAITFTVESEDFYNPIAIYFSLDNKIYQVEDKQKEGIISNGAGFYFTENDYGWCTRCFIYFYVEVTNPGRYYVTGKATARNPVISKSKLSEKFVNLRQQDCFQYFVQSDVTDLMINANQYIGDIEFYIAGQKIPSSPFDNNEVFLRAAKAPQMQLIMTAQDRANFGMKTGLYEICIFGLQEQNSVGITPIEDNTGGRYDAYDNVAYTINVGAKKAASYFRYTSSLLTQASTIQVRLEGLNINTTAGQVPPRILYRVCQSPSAAECFLNTSEIVGNLSNMIQLTPNVVQGSAVRVGLINHSPSVCKNPNSCYYLVSVYNPGDNTKQAYMLTSVQITAQLANTQSITVEDSFHNVMSMGRYFYYQILPGSSESFAYLDSLTIRLESLFGDADLLVSMTKPFPRLDDTDVLTMSRQTSRFDQVTIQKSENFTLGTKPIYIGVYASTLAVYELKFDTKQSLTYQIKLDRATPLVDSLAVPVKYTQEFEESFFSFSPWWPASENRTVVIVADVIFNSIFFYCKLNDFPQAFSTDLQDQQDVISISPSQYKLTDGFYIRTRPDFALYDLISKREYIFNFVAFAQAFSGPTSNRLIDLQIGDAQYGFANSSTNFYRHLLIDKNSTLNVTIEPLIGSPVILVKFSNVPGFPVSSNASSYDWRKSIDRDDVSTQYLRIDPELRTLTDVDCDKAGYPMNGGNKFCTIYIGVECQDPTTACVYKIYMNMEGRSFLNSTNFVNKNIPIYLTAEGGNYQTGTVAEGEIKYYYLPVQKGAGDMVIFLNKTGPLGKNGDTRVLLSVQGNAGSARYANQTNKFDNWFYPNRTYFRIESMTNISTQPEIIEICPRTFDTQCSTDSCVLVLGVVGQTKKLASTYRLTTYNAPNKLYDRKPIQDTIANAGDYKYYWFSSNASVANASAYWEYLVTVALQTSQMDVDIYVSATDARQPSSEDFDFKSDNLGADEVFIRSTDSFWDRSGYYKQYGIVYVVAVKAVTNNATFTLMMAGPQKFEQNYTTMTSSVWYPRQLTAQNSTHIYKWFNWQHRDFKISVDVIDGNITAYYNVISERNYSNNGYLSVPINANNSLWTLSGSTQNKMELRVLKEDPMMFCYYCFYYVTITSTNATAVPRSSYRISISNIADGGEEVPYINVGQSLNIILPSTGATIQRRFILDSKEPFSLVGDINSGSVNIYVTLVPGASQKQLWKADSAKSDDPSQVRISVKQTDVNFHLGTIYYVIVQSTNGRADIKLSLNQKRNSVQLQSGISYKQSYWTSEERVKFYFFQPSQFKQNVKITVNIKSLTPDFYPTLFVSKNSFNQAVNDPGQTLAYPNYANANYTFGDNFTSSVQQNEFTYSFREYIGNSNTYFAFSLYSWTYGLTDMRKPEFRLSLTAETVSSLLQEEEREALYIELDSDSNFLNLQTE